MIEKKYRDRALKKLTVYLTRKKEWTELEWDKLWKALFYCMWMSDKRPVQEELSTNLAALVHRIPSTASALAFIHSFFRTMHREWHGLDGLRLDKFYSLVRKFVRETMTLLCANDWNEELVEQFVTILSTEVVNQLPNGLRMHLADLYLTEMYNAAGKDVTTKAFVALLEPFLMLLRSEYDKTVFKRVRELVFEEMLTKYKFGPQSKQEEDDDDKEETDDEEENEEQDKVFEQVDVAQVQHRIFAIASADDTAERNRSALYTLYKKFFSITRVDSFQAVQEEGVKHEKNSVKKEKKRKNEKSATTQLVPKVTKSEQTSDETTKSKKRKAKKHAQDESKTTGIAKEESTETTSSKKTKTRKINTETKVENVELVTSSTEIKKEMKKHKKTKQEAQVVEKTLVEKKSVTLVKDKTSPQLELKEEKNEKKSKGYVTVTKSGKKFKRCNSCSGFGKGLVPKDKNLCGHCERTQKAQKKKAVSASKKRKAESQVQAALEEQETVKSSKKVKFGKSRALRHKVSIQRLKASAKRDAVSKDMTNVKGVLKMTSSLPVKSTKSKKTKTSTGRKTAADFF